MKISAYVYECDYHCCSCAKKRFGASEYGLSEGIDRHGNPIAGLHPFEMGSTVAYTCGTCNEMVEC